MYRAPLRRRRTWAILAILVLCSPFRTHAFPGSARPDGPRLGLSAAIPDESTEQTMLRWVIPRRRWRSGCPDRQGPALQGAVGELQGDHETLEAFRADALDVGSVADIPPLFAQWNGTDVKIIGARSPRTRCSTRSSSSGSRPGPASTP